MMETALFYLLAAILVTFAVLTITARNPVRSAVYLISALLAVAGLFLLLKAEFVTAVQILVYVGGIMVLFLFVIMLVSVREAVGQRTVSRQWKTAVALALLLSAELLLFLVNGATVFETRSAGRGVMVAPETLNAQTVGQVLYSTYLLPFEIASVLLLVAIIGAVVLSRKQI